MYMPSSDTVLITEMHMFCFMFHNVIYEFKYLYVLQVTFFKYEQWGLAKSGGNSSIMIHKLYIKINK